MGALAPAPSQGFPGPRPRGLLLDAMGTLITLKASVGTTYAAVAAEHGLQTDPAAIDALFPGVYRAAPPLAFALADPLERMEAERRWWADRIREVFQALDGSPEPSSDLVAALFERFADPALWRVYPDVPPCLAAWRRQGLRLAVVSNFDARLHPLLRDLGLEPWLERVIVSSEVGAAKPSAVPFQRALEALGLEPHQAWHVGDQPEDVEGAARAGVRCLRLRRR
ncbi:MAG: HAD-IA family hydrolase [Cyanobacteriota bacterium]|nr:HAD-IA family hydrolase [Cyanobacteriota bacterium]